MQNLQIQDAFEPYYAEGRTKSDKKIQGGPLAAPGLTTAEVKARLENCRLQLARALAATAAQRN